MGKKQWVKRMMAGVLTISMAAAPCMGERIPEVFASYQEMNETTSFEELRKRWNVLLTGGDELDTSLEVTQAYIESVEEAADKHWNALNKLGETEKDERTCLFADLPMTDKKTKTGSSQITLTFDRLKAIVLAYETKGSKFYKEEEVKREIIAALDMMIEKHYSVYYACGGTGTGLGSGNHSFGNWYDWRIGTPRQLCDLLLMLYEDLDENQIARYVEPIMANNKSVDTTGANRTWIANVFIQCGVLIGEGELIEAGKEGLKDVFKYVESGDGFHEDGSFIQHNYYAYTGGYGKALLCTLAPMMNVLNNTSYAISYDDNREQIFFDMLFEAYEPLIYGGRFMDMAREREISRVANQDSIPGRQAIRSMIMLVDVLSGEQKLRAESMVKEWLSDDEVLAQVCVDPIDGYNEYYLPAGVIHKAVEILNSGVESRGNLVKHKRYGAMDRVVHLRDNFGFTISMSSDRIRNTEGTNDEGLRLWNIGDGLTYLYDEDKTYYSDHYWATVDYQRLPGITTNRVSGRAPKAAYGSKNPYQYAGGTDLGDYGIAGMEMQGVGNTSRNGAHAKKSWFMFDDEVVALGSEVRSTLEESPVETIIENRKLRLDKSNVLTVNGEEQTFTEDGEPSIVDNKMLSVTSVTALAGNDVKASRTMETTDANKNIVFECKVKMPVTTDFFAIKLYGSGSTAALPADAFKNNIVFLTMRDGALVPRIGSKDAYSANAALPAKEWHDIKVELNMEKQTFNYYFDGTQIKKGVSTSTNTVAADLENAAFYTKLAGDQNRLTGVEIMAPGSKSGTICVDDIRVTVDGTAVYEESFESYEKDVLANTIASWSVVINDKGKGAGAVVGLEQTTVIPKGEDDFNGVHEDTEWIHLAGETTKSDVGYYFPGKAAVSGLRETRKGSWELVNIYEKFTDKEERINSFATFWFDHGVKPENDLYSYVILPGKSAEETKQYHENPDIEILRQDGTVHAVRETKLGITGMNFFKAGKQGAFRTEQAASVMVQENQEEGTMDISFSDPTQTTKELKLEVSLPIEEVLESSEEIQVSRANGITTFTAVTTNHPWGTAGKSFRVKVKLGGADNMFETCTPGETPGHWVAESGEAVIVVEENENNVLQVTAEEGREAKAETTLQYPADSVGSFISFQMRLKHGQGKIILGLSEEQKIVIDFEEQAAAKAKSSNVSLTPGEWHSIKLKLNQEEHTCTVMIDGKVHGNKIPFEGEVPTSYSVYLEPKSQVQIDNLTVLEASVVPPTRPERLTYTSYGDRFVDLQWDASESENPVSYTVFADGEELGVTTETTYTVSGLQPEETYTFSVQAMDDDENYSEQSVELRVTTIEAQSTSYQINFDDYSSGVTAQNRWSYGGTDPKGKVEILAAPGTKENDEADDMITDLEYWKDNVASTSNASLNLKATSSNITASTSNWKVEKEDKALYVYSGTSASGTDKSAAYVFEKQTQKQTYRLKLFFDACEKYSNFALVGSSGKQAVTIMITDDGMIGYRDGNSPAATVKLLDQKIEGEWIDFTIVADPETQIFSLFVGETELLNRPFRYETPDIQKITFHAPGSATGGYYVDDIVLPGYYNSEKIEMEELADDLSEPLVVPYKTSFYELELPESLMVKTRDSQGETDEVDIRVNWEKGDYDGSKSKTYTLQGTLAYPSNYVNQISDKDIRMKVEVEKEIPVYTVTLQQTAGGSISTDTDSGEEGSSVTVTAEPDDGYTLAGWVKNDKNISETGTSYTFTLEENVTVRAIFEPEAVTPDVKFYTVHAGAVTKGGTVTVSSSYAREGTEIVVSILEDAGYRISELKVNGKKVAWDEDLQYTFQLEKNTQIQAKFMRLPKEDHGSDDDSMEITYKTDKNAPSYAESGTWSMSEDGWVFLTSKGEKVSSRWACILWNGNYEWYYFGKDGKMQTGWIELNGQVFYLHASADGTRGRMLAGWQQIDGVWYYFNEASDGNRGMLVKDAIPPANLTGQTAEPNHK